RWGRLSSVCCVDKARLRGPAAEELEALGKLGVEVVDNLQFDGADVIVDAIFGTGLSRPPEGKFAAWITAINESGKTVIAVDVPSGLDSDSGVAYAPCVRANTTISLGLPNPGLLKLSQPVLLAVFRVPFEVYVAVASGVPA